MGAIGELTRARFRHRPGRWLLVAVGVALALALPVVSAATGRVVAARALASAVEALPVGERTVVAAYGGVQIACGLWAKLRMGGLREIDLGSAKGNACASCPSQH